MLTTQSLLRITKGNLLSDTKLFIMKEPTFPQPEPAEGTNKEKALIILKPATSADVETLLTLKQKMSGLKTYSVMTDPEEQRNELQNTVTYLIEKDGTVVGSISYEIKSEGHAYLSDLIIDPEYQRQGLGREALTRVLKELEQMERVDLVTHPENNLALQLYTSLGFQVESRKEDYYGDGEPRLVLARVNKD